MHWWRRPKPAALHGKPPQLLPSAVAQPFGMTKVNCAEAVAASTPAVSENARRFMVGGHAARVREPNGPRRAWYCACPSSGSPRGPADREDRTRPPRSVQVEPEPHAVAGDEAERVEA